MLFYDWKKIYETCKGNTAEIVRVLKMLVEKQLPVNHYDKIYKYYHIDFNVPLLLEAKIGKNWLDTREI